MITDCLSLPLSGFDSDICWVLPVQIVVITMIALALSEDSISKRAHRDTIIESLAQLPESTRKARHCCSEAVSLLWQCRTSFQGT